MMCSDSEFAVCGVCISWSKKIVEMKVIKFYLTCVCQYVKLLAIIIMDFTIQSYMK
jgi:hypothetical protein